MNVTEAAKSLNVHERTIYNMIKDGRLQATKKGVSWDIPDEVIRNLVETAGRHFDQASLLSAAVGTIAQYQADQKEKAWVRIGEASKDLANYYAENPDGHGWENERDSLLAELKQALNDFDNVQSIDHYLFNLQQESSEVMSEARAILKGDK